MSVWNSYQVVLMIVSRSASEDTHKMAFISRLTATVLRVLYEHQQFGRWLQGCMTLQQVSLHCSFTLFKVFQNLCLLLTYLNGKPQKPLVYIF